MLYQAQVPIHNLPVQLVLLSNGQLMFVRVRTFPALFDNTERGMVSCDFFSDFFVFYRNDEKAPPEENVCHYNTLYYYKQEPFMLEWLTQQKLTLPQFM